MRQMTAGAAAELDVEAPRQAGPRGRRNASLGQRRKLAASTARTRWARKLPIGCRWKQRWRVMMRAAYGQGRSAAGIAAVVDGKHRQRRTSWALFVVVVCGDGGGRERLVGGALWLDKGLASEQARAVGPT